MTCNGKALVKGAGELSKLSTVLLPSNCPPWPEALSLRRCWGSQGTKIGWPQVRTKSTGLWDASTAINILLHCSGHNTGISLAQQDPENRIISSRSSHKPLYAQRPHCRQRNLKNWTFPWKRLNHLKVLQGAARLLHQTPAMSPTGRASWGWEWFSYPRLSTQRHQAERAHSWQGRDSDKQPQLASVPVLWVCGAVSILTLLFKTVCFQLDKVWLTERSWTENAGVLSDVFSGNVSVFVCFWFFGCCR